MSATSDDSLLRLEELVEYACVAIYTAKRGYWPSESERSRIAIALVALAEVQRWGYADESLSLLNELLASGIPLETRAPKVRDLLQRSGWDNNAILTPINDATYPQNDAVMGQP